MDRELLSKPRIRSALGKGQVFFRGKQVTYSQTKDFGHARRSGRDILASDGDGNVARFRPRTWPNSNNGMYICISVGTSMDGGFTEDRDGIPDPTTPFTALNPNPKLVCYEGGVSPVPGGVVIDAAPDLLDATALAASNIVPARNGLNVGRESGRSFTHEQPIVSCGEVIAAAVGTGSIVPVVALGTGGATYNSTMIKVVSISSLSWDGTNANLVLTGAQDMSANDKIWIINAAGAGWNGYWRLASSDGTNASWPIASNPGSATGAVAIIWGPAASNARKVARDLVARATTLSLTPHLAVFAVFGFEPDTNILSGTDWDTKQWGYTRDIVDELGEIINAGDGRPWIGWAQNGYPIFNHADVVAQQGTTNPQAWGVANRALDPANRVFTRARYNCRVGGLGTATTVGSHCSVQGLSYLGEGLGHIVIDIANGDLSNIAPPMIDESQPIVWSADGLTITATLTKAVIKSTDASRMTPIDNGGIAVFADAEAGGNGKEIEVTSVTLGPGLAITITLASKPAIFSGVRIGVAYAGGYADKAVSAIKIQSMSWSNANDELTIVLQEPHDFAPGDSVPIVANYPAGANGTKTAKAGTTGSTLVLDCPVDPGSVSFDQITWSNGVSTARVASGGNILGVEVGSNFEILTSDVAGYVGNYKIRSVASDGTTISWRQNTSPGSSATTATGWGGGRTGRTGQYSTGDINGNRSQYHVEKIDHYSLRDGKPLEHWLSPQFPSVMVKSRSKRLSTILSQLGLSNAFELVMQPGDDDCYVGTGTSLVNQGTSGSVNNFTMQNGLVFFGSADAADRTAGVRASGTSRCALATNTPDVFTDLHKVSALGELWMVVKTPASLSSLNWLASTTDGTGAGWRLTVSSVGALNFSVFNAAAASVLSRSHNFVSLGAYGIIGFGMDNLSNESWMLNSFIGATMNDAFLNYVPVYGSTGNAPATGAANAKLTIGRNGGGATVLNSNWEILALLGSNVMQPARRREPLFSGLYRAFVLNDVLS